ncbi:MAG TPA: CNP1-like family protein, partial [Ramlibacter sp.]|nr:CNP1-like family protein [Ramlibacter sp.]
MLRRFLALALAGAAVSAAAQLVPDIHIDWKEAEAPPPPALRTRGLIPVEVAGTTLRFGVDPDSITVGSDGVVRYVVVATSNTGAVNGIYEGIKCNTGEAKVYARHNPDTGWVPAKGDWRNVYGIANTRYTLAIAKSGACKEHAPNGTPA